MKSTLRIICASIVTILLFNLFSWFLMKLLEGISDWQLFWFIIICIIAYFVLVNLVNFLSKLVLIIVRYSESRTQFLAIKWVLLIVSWGMAIVCCDIIFRYIDFSITKLWVYGVLVVLVYISIPITINKKVKTYIAIFEKGYKMAYEYAQANLELERISNGIQEYGYQALEMGMGLAIQIKSGKITYTEALKQIADMRELNLINNVQVTDITNIIQKEIA